MVSYASAQLFPDFTLSSLTNFLLEQLNLEGQWEVAISGRSYPSRYQNVTEGKLLFFDENFSKSSEFQDLEPGLYPSFTDFVEAKNTAFQERHNHSESCITIKVSGRTQKVYIYLAKEISGFAFVITDLGHFFGSFVGNDFGKKLRVKGTHLSEFVYNIVRIHFPIIYLDLVEYKIVGDTKLHWCFCFI